MALRHFLIVLDGGRPSRAKIMVIMVSTQVAHVRAPMTRGHMMSPVPGLQTFARKIG